MSRRAKKMLCLMQIAVKLCEYDMNYGVRRYAVRPINRSSSIGNKRQYNYFKKMRDEDGAEFFKYTRMDRKTYFQLLRKISPLISGKSKRAMPADMKLAICLQYLTQGTSKQKEAWVFEIGVSTVAKVVAEVCDAVIKVLQDEVMPPPTRDDWTAIANGFEERWNIPNVIGALDGKHLPIKKPKNSGSAFLNYKGSFSIVLMATVDANFRFRVVDVGSYGSEHDAGVFKATTFGQALSNEDGTNAAGVPEARPIAGMPNALPYFVVADDAFPLKENIMKPYGGRGLTERQMVFNYRLSRARRVVENAFGILATRFRMMLGTIHADPEKVEKYVFCCILLHNYIIDSQVDRYCPADYVDREDEHGNCIPGLFREIRVGLQSLPPTQSRNFRRTASNVREQLADWFLSDHGFLEWQTSYVRRFRGLH